VTGGSGFLGRNIKDVVTTLKSMKVDDLTISQALENLSNNADNIALKVALAKRI
jgi:SOS response regulatory protein OraA/RecX